MMLPIVAYGHPTLKQVAKDIPTNYPELQTLIDNMFETMYSSNGIGLAAPQINLPIRLFVIDASAFAKEYPETATFKKIFINPHIIEESGEEWAYNEGCLSVPGIHEDVMRKPNIVIRYMDEQFIQRQESYTGIIARIIQHEYDHLEGELFVDKVSNIRKVLLRKKLANISKGDIEVDYRMIFPLAAKQRRGR